MRLKSLFRLLTIARVPVLVHWSTPLLAALYLLVSLDRWSRAVAAILGYFVVLLVHELGHQFVASRLDYHVIAIEIYPYHGLCRFDRPETKLDDAKIAWGGVVAQILFAIPAIVRLALGYTSFGPFNTFLRVCGPTSVAIAIFNLLPISPLDGKTAWSLFPQLWRKYRARPSKPEKTALEVFEEMARKKRE